MTRVKSDAQAGEGGSLLRADAPGNEPFHDDLAFLLTANGNTVLTANSDAILTANGDAILTALLTALLKNIIRAQCLKSHFGLLKLESGALYAQIDIPVKAAACCGLMPPAMSRSMMTLRSS